MERNKKRQLERRLDALNLLIEMICEESVFEKRQVDRGHKICRRILIYQERYRALTGDYYKPIYDD